MNTKHWRVYFIDHEAVSVEAACPNSARLAAEALRPGLKISRVEPRRP